MENNTWEKKKIAKETVAEFKGRMNVEIR